MFKALIFHLVEDLIRPLSGPVGRRLRRAWYGRRLAQCGADLVVDPGVFLVNPAYMELGDRVWIDRQVTLIAGPPKDTSADEVMGRLRIGHDSHLGHGTVIQAHGGVRAGDGFTTAPGVKIYTQSNDYRHIRNGTVRNYDRKKGIRTTAVSIGRNVWLGMNSIMVGHTIGDDVFVRPGSVVTRDLPNNCVAGGDPAAALHSRFEGEGRE
ncbi:MAG: acyltransferase [Pseudomonadota bacterium]